MKTLRKYHSHQYKEDRFEQKIFDMYITFAKSYILITIKRFWKLVRDKILENKTEPEILYHYTDLNALINILKKENNQTNNSTKPRIQLRATDFRFLNDTTELRLVLENRIKNIKESIEISSGLADYFKEKFIEVVRDNPGLNKNTIDGYHHNNLKTSENIDTIWNEIKKINKILQKSAKQNDPSTISSNLDLVSLRIGYCKILNSLWRKQLETIERLDKEIQNSDEIFIISFSANEDSLSQWRGYAHDGYAIGFNKKFLDKWKASYPPKNESSPSKININLDLHKCDYKFSKIISDINESYDKTVEAIKRIEAREGSS